MANQNAKSIVLPRSTIRKKEGVVVFDLEKYRLIEKELEEYRTKEKLLRSLRNFEGLAKRGRAFARKQKITKRQVLEND